ncbi:MAG: hypothetical protein H0T89_03640, partial [Deltaproteobacteria bacterium]|nr:hypothetical protein [Deltaproteobacteria bacterium]
MARTNATKTKPVAKETKPVAKKPAQAPAKADAKKVDAKKEKDAKADSRKDDIKNSKLAKATASPAISSRAVAAKPARSREDDDDFGSDSDEDDDFVPIPKAPKPGAKAPGKGGKTPIPTFDEDDDIGPALALDDDEDDFVPGAPKPSRSAEADAAALEAETRAAKKGGRAAGGAGKDSMRDKLIELGKQKGFVTYDEVNDHMPEDVVSTDQIDGWLSVLGEHGIEVVDAGARRTPDIVDAPAAIAIEKEDGEKEVDEDEEYAYSRTSDPVRMYLRKMGSVSLLTREGEVEIAKRIEDGERKMLQAVL